MGARRTAGTRVAPAHEDTVLGAILSFTQRSLMSFLR